MTDAVVADQLPWTPFSFDWDVIVVHGPCPDGRGSGWIVWRQLPEDYRAALKAEGGLYAEPLDANEPFVLSDKDSSPTCIEGARRLQQRGFPVVFVSVHPEEPMTEQLVSGKRVLFCDRGPGSDARGLLTWASRVRVIDHHSGNERHIRAAAALDAELNAAAPKFSARFDPAKLHSGASLTWQEFYPSEPIPPLVRCIQIQDTWNWDQEPALDARLVNLALGVNRMNGTFVALEQCYQRWSLEGDAFRQRLVAQGAVMQLVETREVESIARGAKLGFVVARVRVEGTLTARVFAILYVNSCVHASEVGNAMRTIVAPAHEARCRRIDATAVWRYYSDSEEIGVSLRGNAAGVNLGELAPAIVGPGKKGGGGHAAAAGFVIVGLANFHSVIHRTLEAATAAAARDNESHGSDVLMF